MHLIEGKGYTSIVYSLIRLLLGLNGYKLGIDFKESPLSRLSYQMFNKHIGATSTSEEQLRREIETKLQETGLYNLDVQLVKENGRKQVKFASNGKTSDFSIELTLRDGSNVTAIGEKL